MLPVERIIGEEGLSADGKGLRLAMRLPWYRSLPFSTVEVAGLEIDGDSVDLSTARIEYDGHDWSFGELGEQTNQFWFVRDSAFLSVPGRTLAPGSEHRVALTINVNPPYIPGMKRSNVQHAALRVS